MPAPRAVLATACVLAVVTVALPAHADSLDCDSDLAVGRQVFKLGKLGDGDLELVTCTDSADLVLGRAYFSHVRKGKRVTQELEGIGGCDKGAVHARRADDSVLVTFRTCASRSYHPAPRWVVRDYRIDEKTGELVATPWKPVAKPTAKP